MSFVNAAAVERFAMQSNPPAQSVAERHARAAFEDVTVDAVVGLEHEFAGGVVHQEHGAHAFCRRPRIMKHQRKRALQQFLELRILEGEMEQRVQRISSGCRGSS